MFRDFLDIRQKSESIFSGLKVMDNSDLVEGYMNKNYESQLKYESYTVRLQYAMAFNDKKCIIKKV